MQAMSVVSSCQETTWTIQLQVYGCLQELDFFVFSDTLSVRPTLRSSCKDMCSSYTCLSRLLNGEEDCNQSILSVCCTSRVIFSFCILLYIILYKSVLKHHKKCQSFSSTVLPAGIMKAAKHQQLLLFEVTNFSAVNFTPRESTSLKRHLACYLSGLPQLMYSCVMGRLYCSFCKVTLLIA